jgi:chemotaxis signal transduction protein
VSEATSELLLFQLGARVYAAQVDDIRRVGSVRSEQSLHAVGTTVLGEPLSQERGIVVDLGDAQDHTLLVDHVIGVRTVAEEDLRALPAFAAACLQSEAITGFAMVDESPLLLVDLSTLIREHLRQDAAAAARKGATDA